MSVFKENDILPAICPFQSQSSYYWTFFFFFYFLFILPLTFNHHFIPFLDGEPAELIKPVTHTQATTRMQETLKQSEGEKLNK